MPGDGLAFADEFDGAELDRARWLPAYLPQWSSRERAAARYRIADGRLRLRIDADQEPWCPEFDGGTKVSSLQTGVFSGPLGSGVGQHRFRPEVVVRQEQVAQRLFTPVYGRIELRAKMPANPACMAALWLIGYEDAPERSGEICVCEVFGRDIGPGRVAVGMGVNPFGDPGLRDDFARVELPIDATRFHVYAADWRRERVDFFVDGVLVRTVPQSPAYPMQLMLGLYEFEGGGGEYPKEFVVDFVRVHEPQA